MKKFYFIFFICISSPLFVLAQANSAKTPKPKQPATKILPATPKATLATQPAQTAPKILGKQPVKTFAKGSSQKSTVKQRRKVSSTTIYGNEWINYSQRYFKIKIPFDSIYRIDSLTLAKAGIPVDSIDSRRFQMFFRGQEQYIFIHSRTTYLSQMNGDYIEFYGQRNDGVPDSLVYYKSKFLPNPYYSMFNDSSTYYITWNASLANHRMTEQTDTIWVGTAAPYVMTSALIFEKDTIFFGAKIADGDFLPNDPRFFFDETYIGSVYNGLWMEPASSINFTPNFNGNYVYTGAGAPSAFVRTVLSEIKSGLTPFTITSSARQLWTNDTIQGYGTLDLDTTFPASDLTVPSFKFTYFDNASISSTNSWITPTYLYLSYPHSMPDLGGDTTMMMGVEDDALHPKAYLNFTNIFTKFPSDTVRMYDLTNHNRFWVKNDGANGFKVLVPNSGAQKQCYLTSDSYIHKIKQITPVGKGRNGYFTNYATEPDSAYIIVTHPSLYSGAEAYAQYRKSTGYDTVVADVYELYDQFGEGVDYSPLGIKRFCNYAIDKWASPPSNLFLIGKGIHPHAFRHNNLALAQLFVPSFGDPCSDMLFTYDLDADTMLVPAIPTGRLAAITNADVTTYLGKVNTYEHAAPALWMKNVAQFAGGNSIGQAGLFVTFLNQMSDTISDTLYGGHRYLFEKYTTAPINSSLTDSVINLVNNGVSLMTFFGHASGSDWDETVDYPSQYANYNKYPFMIADACFSGDMYSPEGISESNLSEQWVLQYPGAIGFLASDYLGDALPLRTWTQKVYDDIAHRPFYGKPIGEILQNTILEEGRSSDIFMTYTCMEMNLHGDPALVINSKPLPDYAVTNQSIYFSPPNVSVLQTTFNVNVIVSNYGEALPQLVSGVLTRQFPDGAKMYYPFSFQHVYYQDTVSIKMKVNISPDTLGAGLNYFSVYVNKYPSADTELNYGNNEIDNVPFVISSEDITPIWPYDYAIIPKNTVTLKASTDDPFAPSRGYVFEIDTTPDFNSNLFRSVVITNSGGVIEASPYANWGTTHYAPVRHEPFNLATTQNGIGKKNTESKNAGSTAINENTGSAVIQNNPAAKGKLLPQQAQHASAGGEPALKPIDAKATRAILGDNNQLGLKASNSHHGPVNLSFLPNTVYYWRVKRDTADLLKYPWTLTSFQYISGKNGWGQSHFFQFDNSEMFNEIYSDNYNFITYDTTNHDWHFNTNGHTLQCNTWGMQNTVAGRNTTELYSTDYKIDDYVQAYAGCSDNAGIYVAVIDSATLVPWNTLNYNFGNANNANGPSNFTCEPPPQNVFIFFDGYKAQTDSLVKMLKAIPNGDYILAYSWIEGAYTAPVLTNAGAVDTAFSNLGFTNILAHTQPGMDSVPFIFFVQKGHPSGRKIQDFGTSLTSALQDTITLRGNGTYGAISTPLIGPASKYDSLSWGQHTYDKGPLTDSTRLSVVGIQPNGIPKTLISNVTPAVANMYISSINPVLFPFIQLVMFTKDIIHHTPAQMNFWRVFYQPVPEIAMNPNVYTSYHADTLSFGDTLRFQTVVQNVSDWPIATTQLLAWTTDNYNNIKYIPSSHFTSTVKALNPGDTAKIAMWMYDTNNSASALRSVWFEVNPENYPNTRLEQFHFNNYAEKSFYSYGDKINPLVDVTFDGIHILNNDIVSPQPNILITFKDENKYLALNNPNDFQVYLRNVTLNGAPFKISYGPSLSFTPAVLPNNKCSLLYTPKLSDGTYELTVQGTDISGNFSAHNSYKVDFQVINKSSISEVLNYPNPFSTSTRFVFILTGDQIPTTFKIQIMTVTGKIIREITEDEIGPIHVGRNITQYAWDGTDKYGSKLANGVYLYRVVSAINGQSIDDYNTAADQYFTKGWGKMYIMH